MSTIAAISTPFGRGGIAVIRMSGENSLNILSATFKPKSGRELTEYGPNKMIYGDIIKDGKIIDNGMAVYFKAPASYTGEDSAELHCHGGILLSQLVLEAVYSNGAVPARAGEFTERAFLSGKMGLTQAEAVIDLIDAESEAKAVLSASQAGGRLSEKINKIYEELIAVVSSIYAYIDYPDEDLTDITVDDMKERLSDIIASLRELKSTYHTGKAVSEGIKTVIVGKPNTGKSSLLNMLLGEERAIVTPIAGTTRDTVEETAVAGKVLLKLCDTAGIRESNDTVEALGVERSLSKLESAELVLAVFDNSNTADSYDEEFLNHLKAYPSKNIIALFNKTDLGHSFETSLLSGITDNILEISAKNGTGKYELIELIENLYIKGQLEYDSAAIVTNARQFASLGNALNHLDAALAALNAGFTQDVAGLELELALSELGEVDGRKVSDDIVSNIFHRFCVGK